MIKNLSRRKLNRPSSHRIALLRNLATNLVKHESITTTVAKAKELRWYIDRLITKVKKASLQLNKYRIAKKYLTTKDAVQKFVKIIVPRYSQEGYTCGYTKMARLNNRKGDNAEMAIIKFK